MRGTGNDKEDPVNVINRNSHFSTIILAIHQYYLIMSKSDRQPLLPTHRLAQGRISFPSSSTSALDPDSASTLVDADAAAPSRKPPRSRSGNQDGSLAVPKAKRQGLPKLSRECLWRYV